LILTLSVHCPCHSPAAFLIGATTVIVGSVSR